MSGETPLLQGFPERQQKEGTEQIQEEEREACGRKPE
jgi:hypothetical protein